MSHIVSIFIQYFDLETSWFIRLVSDISKIKSWASGDALAVLFHFPKKSPACKWHSWQLSISRMAPESSRPAHQGIFHHSWQPSPFTQHPSGAHGKQEQALLGSRCIWCPAAGVLHKAHRQLDLKQTTSRVVYFILGTRPAYDNLRSGAPERGEATLVKSWGRYNSAGWKSSQTNLISNNMLFTSASIDTFGGFFFLWDWGWWKPIHDKHFMNNVTPYVNVLFV